MPGPLLIPLIMAGSNIGGQGINAIAQGAINKKTRAWNEKMYGWQRRDALADWNMQNLYNSPQEQMARLKMAGLNPNLVYGTGATANNASSVRSSSPGDWNPRAPQFDIGGAAGSAISAYYDTQMKTATIDNLRKTGDVLDQEKYLKLAQTLNTAQTTDVSKFDLGLKTDLRDTAIAAAHAGVEKTKQETELIITENEFKKAIQQPTIDRILQEILNMKKELLLKGKQIELTDWNINKVVNEIDEIKAKVTIANTEGKLKKFDLMLKEVRGKASDYPGLWKVVGDAFRLVEPNLKYKKLEKY